MISNFKGKQHTEKSKELIRQRALLQFKHGMSPETKEKISKSMPGIKKSKLNCDFLRIGVE